MSYNVFLDMKKNIVITGASGFVGANLAHDALNKGHDVHILVRPGFKKWRLKNIINDLHIHKIDIQSQDMLKQLFKKIKPEWIFHTAVHGAYSSQTNLDEIVNTNILGTISLI